MGRSLERQNKVEKEITGETHSNYFHHTMMPQCLHWRRWELPALAPLQSWLRTSIASLFCHFSSRL